MASLTPYAQLTLAYDRQFYGAVTYCGDDITWPLPEMLARADVPRQGLSLDPTGGYAIQTPVYVPQGAGAAAWVLATAGGAAYGDGTDEQTGAAYLRQTVGTYGVSFGATLKAVRGDDAGFAFSAYRGGPVSASATPAQVQAATGNDHTFSVEFCANSATNVSLRLACNKGEPIRLEATADGGATWQTAQTADALGDSEAYLQANNRTLTVSVLPLTDGTYYARAADSARSAFGALGFGGDPPPGKVIVTVGNGDAVLEWRADRASFPGGSLRVAGSGGQWSLRLWQMWHQAAGSVTLPAQLRPRQFQSAPYSLVSGYVPAGHAATVTPTVLDLHNASATLTVSGPPTRVTLPPASVADVCPKTVVLSSALLDFPPAFLGAQTGVGQVTYDNTRIVEWTHEHRFTQSCFLGRSAGSVTLVDNGNSLTPGAGLSLGVKAAQLYTGLTSAALGYDDGQTAITGLAGLGPGGLRWHWEGGQKFVTVSLSDRVRPNVPVAFAPVMDGQCHYYAMRQLGYRMGFTDEAMAFPYCLRDSGCPHYHLPQGTTLSPLWRFPPNMTVLEAMLDVRAASGDIDPASGAVLPMYLYADRGGLLQYFPAPVGLVNLWLDPTVTPQSQTITLSKTFSVTPALLPGGLPALNEFVRSGPTGTRATLDNIRAPILLQGIRPTDGAFVEGYYSDEGLITDPTRAGYVGLPVPYVQTSRLFSSAPATAMALAVAAVQMSFPSIDCDFHTMYQSGLFGLQLIGLQEPGVTGTSGPVPFYTTYVRSHARSDGSASDTYAEGRLLGQAGG